MKAQPTITEFKQWAKDVEPAARAVLMARVFAELERERVTAYTRPIFDSYHFTYGITPDAPNKYGQVGPITDPQWLYMCNDEIMCKAYYEDCDKAHREHGFTGPHGHCPALIAEHLVMTTEGLFMDLAEPLFGIKSNEIFSDNRVKYLELLIGACFAEDKGAQNDHHDSTGD